MAPVYVVWRAASRARSCELRGGWLAVRRGGVVMAAPGEGTRRASDFSAVGSGQRSARAGLRRSGGGHEGGLLGDLDLDPT